MRFISEHKERFGVEPICRVLTEHGCQIAPSTYYDAVRRAPCARAARDERLRAEVSRVHAANYGVYGARKVWLQLNREGIAVARCTVERLMRELDLAGARGGKRVRTTIRGDAAAHPATWSGGSSAGRPGPALGRGVHLRPDLERHGLRRIRHRRLLPADPGLARRPVDEDRPGPGRARAGPLGPAAQRGGRAASTA